MTAEVFDDLECGGGGGADADESETAESRASVVSLDMVLVIVLEEVCGCCVAYLDCLEFDGAIVSILLLSLADSAQDSETRHNLQLELLVVDQVIK